MNSQDLGRAGISGHVPDEGLLSERDWKKVKTVTAFVDLLGLSNALIRLDQIDEQLLGKDEATPLFEDSIYRVVEIRRVFVQLFEAYAVIARKRQSAPNGVEMSLIDEVSRLDSRLVAFSDCVLINVIIDEDALLGAVRGILNMFNALIYACAVMLTRMQLMRGGIDAGVAIDNGAQEVLGAGLARAYRLESKIAIYPRIVVGKKFLGLLEAVKSKAENREDSNNADRVRRLRHAVGCIEKLLVCDADDVTRLRLITPSIIDVFRQEGRDVAGDVVKGIASIKNAEHGNEKHLQKINWVMTAFRSDLAVAAPGSRHGSR